MTSPSDILIEAAWNLEMAKKCPGEGYAETAAVLVGTVSAQLGGTPTETSYSKRKRKKTKTPARKKKKASPPLPVTLLLAGPLPDGLTSVGFRAAVLPMMEDVIEGEVMYKGFNRMNNGTYCYNFSGMCPCHHRVHKGGAHIWQLKQHPSSAWCGFKCWKQDSFKRQFSNPILCDLH